MNKILVPFDFSDVARHALDFAADLAQRTSGCEVTVINVIEQPTPDTIKTMGIVDYDPMANVYLKQLIQTVKGKMDTLMADSTFKDIKLNYKVVLGQPFKEISEEIATKGIELVVMGTYGASGAEEFFVGSNAERMVRRAKCPVITINQATTATSIKNIVLASDFHEVPDAFIKHVKSLQKLFGAHFKLVKINTPASFTTSRHDRKQMENFVKTHQLSDCTFESYNYTNEEDGIIAFAEDINADLIALGTHQRKGIGHFLSGSIAEDVVNHAKVPVWTYRL